MAVFGASLESVVKTQTLPSPPVPHLVLLCAAHIEEEGEEQRFRAEMKRRGRKKIDTHPSFSKTVLRASLALINCQE